MKKKKITQVFERAVFERALTFINSIYIYYNIIYYLRCLNEWGY